MPDFSQLNPDFKPQLNPNFYPTTTPSDVAYRQIDPVVGRVSPALYAAGSTTALTVEDQNLVENWSKVKELHDKLMAMPNAKAAKQYNLLQPSYQKALYDYYGVDYANKPSNSQLIDSAEWKKAQQPETQNKSLWDSAKQIATSPFRFLMHGADFYAHILSTPIHMIENAAINNQSFWSKKNLEASFDGKMLYDNNQLNALIKRYGQETSFVATHILAGETPGQIIQQYGPKSKALLEEINKLSNNPKAYQEVLNEYNRARLSPGRDIARWLNNALGIRTNEHAGLFNLGSGAIDAAFSIFTDPLTYLTMGGSAFLKGASEATKLGEALATTGDVAAHFANPKVKAFWEPYNGLINNLKDAREAGNSKEAAKIVKEIKTNFAEHATDGEIETYLSRAKNKGYFNAEEYFSEAERDISPLFRGATASTMYAREGAAFARASRARTLGIKEKTIDFFRGKPDYDALDAQDMDTFLNEAKALGADRAGIVSRDEMDRILNQRASKGLRAAINRQSAYAPGSKAVYITNEDVAKTAEIFRRRAFLALNDRVLADTLTQHFLEVPQADRLNILRFIDDTTLRRFGVDKLGEEGKLFAQKVLDSRYGTGESMASRETLKRPINAPTADAGQEVAVEGPLHSHQMQDMVSALNLRAIKEFTAGKYVGDDAKLESKVEKASRVIGGAYNSKITNAITDIWSVLTLVPQLGIRTAIDEGYQFAMYMNLPMFKDLLNAKRAQKVLTAYSGDPKSYGPAKEALFRSMTKMLGRPVGAASLVSPTKRIAMRESALSAAASSKKITYAEAEKQWKNQVFDMAISKYGKKLPPEYKTYLRQMADINPNSLMDSISARGITKAIMGRDEALKIDPAILTPDALSAAMDAHGVQATGIFRSEVADRMTKTDLQLAMFRQFVTHFNATAMKYGKDLDVPSIFLKNNGLRTAKDWDKAVSDFMERLGYDPLDPREFLHKQSTEDFLNSSTHFNKYGNLNDVEKVREFALDSLSDLYHVFHGNGEQFNDALIKYFKPFISKNGTVSDHRILVNQLNLDDYADLTKNHLATGRIYTDLEQMSPSLEESIRRVGINGAYDLMARQTDSILRQPAVHLHYLFYRKQYAPLEKKMADAIYKDMQYSYWNMPLPTLRKWANDQAARHFTSKAMDDAANHIMKFSDNPDMRTIFADNIRSVGRFYRAIEDFHRRSYRLMRDNGLGTLYKMRLQSQGLAAFGKVHTDQNGDQYVVMPFDNVLYGAVNKVLRALDPESKGVTQPIFDNITFKLTAGNPSFQNDAGMPYLSGPLAGISVLLAKGILAVPNVAVTNKLSNNVDNFALGSYGDNINLQKVLMPRVVQNLWNDLNPDEQSQQEVSALTQAICYNTAHNINIPNPDDFKDSNGNINTDKFVNAQKEYLHQLRISSHNIVVLRGLLGMIMPSTVQLSDTKDLPDYLKNNGLPSLQSSFYDVLDAIDKKYPDVQDKYELALATWSAKNPNKLVYTLSKKNKEIQPILTYSKDMENWVVENKSLVNAYGAGATLFAPNTGKFDPGSYNYMAAAGLTGNVDIENFYKKALMQSAVNRYYAIGDYESNQLQNIPFSDVATRQAIINNAAQQRSLLQLSVPGLKEYLQPTVANTDAIDFVSNAHAFANAHPDKVNKDVLQKINQAYDIYNDFINYVNNVDTWNVSDSSSLKLAKKDEATKKLLELVASDDTKVLEQYYNYGIKKIMNENVRDARVSVSRNDQ